LLLTAHFINRFLRRLAEGDIADSVSARTPPQAVFLFVSLLPMTEGSVLLIHQASRFLRRLAEGASKPFQAAHAKPGKQKSP